MRTDVPTGATIDGATIPSLSFEESIEAGEKIGKYIVLDRIGAGGMGVVFGAYDAELDRKIAIKLLRAGRDGTVSTTRVERTVREARAMARLSHPNVATVHEVGLVGERVFIAMEFVAGQTLAAWMKQSRTWQEVVDVFTQAGRGLQAAHAEGILHRDFKPENVMVGNDGRARVMDFGLARGLDDVDATRVTEPGPAGDETLTRTGAVLGTPAYMSPEQHVGTPVDRRSDLFSFCVALYQGLYGERPFEGDSQAALALSVTQGSIRAATADSRVPGWLRKVVMRGLQPAREDRWDSMESLLAALARRPMSGGQKIALGAGGVVLVAVVSSPLWAASERPCQGADTKLEAIWSPRRSDTVAAAFSAIGLAHAESEWTRTRARLDGFGEEWIAHHTEACEATAVRKEQSQARLDLRMACLQRRLGDLDAVASVLETVDVASLEHVETVVDGLGMLATCDDDAYLNAAVRPPEDPATAAAVASARSELSRATALQGAGRIEEGSTIAKSVAVSDAAAAYAPLEAEALYRIGAGSLSLGNHDEALAELRSAYLASVRAAHDSQAIDAALALVEHHGDDRRDEAQALLWTELAGALLDRTPGDSQQRARLATQIGLAHARDARHDEARAAFVEAIEMLERMLGHDDTSLREPLQHLSFLEAAAGDLDAAHEHAERAVAIAKLHYGSEHPAVAGALDHLGSVYEMRGEYAKSSETLERTIAIQKATLPPDHPSTIATMNNLANAYTDVGREQEALDLYMHVLGAREKSLAEDHPLIAGTLHNIGSVHLDLGHYEESVDYTLRAIESRRASLSADHPDIALSLNNLGISYLSAEKVELAIIAFEDAVRGLEASLGEEHPVLAYPLTGLGRAHLEAGHPKKALGVLERALALREGKPGPAGDLAQTRFNLAKALVASGSDRNRARALALQVVDYYEAESHADDGRDEVTAWLAANGG